VPEDEFLTLLDLLAERRAGDVFAFVARLADAGVDFGQFLTGFADMVRAQLAVTLGGTPPEVSDRVRDALVARRESFDAGDLLRMLQATTELEPRFRKSGQQQLLLEALLVRFALLDRTVSLEAVLRGLGGSGGGPAEEPAPRRRAAPSTAPEAGKASSRPVEPPARSDTPVSVARTVVRDADRAPAPSAPTSLPVQRDAGVSRSAGQAPGGVTTSSEPDGGVPELHRLAERWDDLVGALRSAGKSVAATALEHAAPLAVNARGDVTIALDEANPIYEQALETAKADVAAILQRWFSGVQRIGIRAAQGGATPPGRLTDEMVRTERLTALRRRDPVLGAAIDALDLDLAD
jgi:DNA polymerase-3 subunit gamma/tau